MLYNFSRYRQAYITNGIFEMAPSSCNPFGEFTEKGAMTVSRNLIKAASAAVVGAALWAAPAAAQQISIGFCTTAGCTPGAAADSGFPTAAFVGATGPFTSVLTG